MNKQTWKLIGFETLYLVVVFVLTMIGNYITFIGKKYDHSYSGIIFSGKYYTYNIFAYVLGTVFFFVPAYFSYRYILQKRMSILGESKLIARIAFFIVALLMLFAIFVAIAMEMFLILGLGDDIGPSVLFVLIMGWPIVVAIFMGILAFRPYKTECMEE